jgi:molybdopterin molybdotransferase
LDSAGLMPAESVDLRKALNRILAEDIIADINIPPFDKSAMDGYAIRKADMDHDLEIIETVPAGKPPEKEIGPGQCAKIMTGAIVPQGADMVVMKEDVEDVKGETIRINRKSAKTNICLCGEDIAKGDKVLNRGTQILPAHIAMLASMGITEPGVYALPRIALFATGSELVEPGEKISPAKIRNSNSYQILAQLERLGITADYLGILSDNEKELQKTIAEATENYDVLIGTGGVSVGEYDLMPSILESVGYSLLIESLSIQPGKPLKFAVKSDKYCFALSGNPVSSYLQFELLVVPFLQKLMGGSYATKGYPVEMLSDFKRKKAQRDLYIPVHVKQGKAEIVRYNGSAHIEAYTRANAVIRIEKNKFEISKGEIADARSL